MASQVRRLPKVIPEFFVTPVDLTSPSVAVAADLAPGAEAVAGRARRLK